MNYRILIFSLMVSTGAGAQHLPPAPHTTGFEASFVEPHTVTGKIVNLPADYVGRSEVVFYTATIGDQPYHLDTIHFDAEGNFSYTLPFPYPVVDVMVQSEGLFFENLWLNGDISFTYDVEENNSGNSEGGAKFSGAAAELSKARYDVYAHIDTKIYQYYNANSLSVVIDDEKTFEERKRLLDSLHNNRINDQAAYLLEAPEKFSQLWRINQNNEYLSYLLMLHHQASLDVPPSLTDQIRAIDNSMVSNEIRGLYINLSYTLEGDSLEIDYKNKSLNPMLRAERQAARSCRVYDSEFLPAEGDVLKLSLQHEDPAIHLAMLEVALPTVSTNWVREAMASRMEELRDQLAVIGATIRKPVAPSELSEYSTFKGQVSNGGYLYVVKEGFSGNSFLDHLRGTFPGKYLYLDFWAVWCGPCIDEMKPSAQLHAEMEGLPIEFIYLCTTEGGKETKWREIIEQYKLQGTHLLVDERTHTDLMGLFGIYGFPKYLLLSPDGKVDLAVGRPSENDRESMAHNLNGK